MKKGVALYQIKSNQIKSNWNLHRNFPFITFIYILVAETVSDSLLAVLCLVIQSCLTLRDPMDSCQAPLSMGFSRQESWSGLPCPPSGDLPDPGIKPRCPALQTDSLPSEPPGKPKNTGVGSWSLLQGIFSSHELNQGLLHCRQILYQLSYQGSPLSP